MSWRARDVALSRVSERDRRTLGIGAIVVLGLFVLFRGIPAWRAWVTSNQAAAAQVAHDLALARQVDRSADGIHRLADSLARLSLGLAPAFIGGDSPAQTTAALASYLSETASTAGVQLSGVQLSVDSARRGAATYRVHVQADGNGDIRGLTTLFQLLEGGTTPLVRVRAFTISQSEPNGPANHAETLHATFALDALARQEDEP